MKPTHYFRRIRSKCHGSVARKGFLKFSGECLQKKHSSVSPVLKTKISKKIGVFGIRKNAGFQNCAQRRLKHIQLSFGKKKTKFNGSKQQKKRFVRRNQAKSVAGRANDRKSVIKASDAPSTPSEPSSSNISASESPKTPAPSVRVSGRSRVRKTRYSPSATPTKTSTPAKKPKTNKVKDFLLKNVFPQTKVSKRAETLSLSPWKPSRAPLSSSRAYGPNSYRFGAFRTLYKPKHEEEEPISGDAEASEAATPSSITSGVSKAPILERRSARQAVRKLAASRDVEKPMHRQKDAKSGADRFEASGTPSESYDASGALDEPFIEDYGASSSLSETPKISVAPSKSSGASEHQARSKSQRRARIKASGASGEIFPAHGASGASLPVQKSVVTVSGPSESSGKMAISESALQNQKFPTDAVSEAVEASPSCSEASEHRTRTNSQYQVQRIVENVKPERVSVRQAIRKFAARKAAEEPNLTAMDGTEEVGPSGAKTVAKNAKKTVTVVAKPKKASGAQKRPAAPKKSRNSRNAPEPCIPSPESYGKAFEPEVIVDDVIVHDDYVSDEFQESYRPMSQDELQRIEWYDDLGNVIPNNSANEEERKPII